MPLARLPARRRLETVSRCPGCDLGPACDLRVVTLEPEHAACRLGLFESGDVVAFRFCSSCGMVFLTPRPSEETLALYYRETCPRNEDHTLPPDRETNPRYRRRQRARFGRLARLASRHAARPKVVADLGALDGASLVPFLARGARAIAVDPGFLSRDAADRRIEHRDSLAALRERGPAPDVVLSTQTFEHLGDPLAMAREIAATLVDGGVAVIEVPYDLLEMGFLFDAGAHVPELHPEHLNFYSSWSLASLMAHAGLELQELRVGAQIHAYGGLIPSITAVGRRTPQPAAPVAPRGHSLAELPRVIDGDRWRVRVEQQRLKVLGVLTRRGRW
jgi:SAM-dependent methyltransferase